MRKAYLFFFTLFISSSFLQAQQTAPCGTDLYIQMQAQKDPSYLQRLEQGREEIERWTANHPADTRSTYVVPVVVHVIWNKSIQNISDEQVQSQIDVLNEDFNRLNADTSKTPAPFKSVAAGISIKFCLAAYDPNGNPTNGITRTQTDVTAFYLGDSMKHTSQGGEDAWPTSEYLNFWVCDLSGGVLGYAVMPSPGNPPAEDGLVLRYNAFGRVGVLDPSYNKGRTASHETGHWFGLYHTFEGGCISADNCSDTPPEAEAIFGCPSFPHISCSNGPNGDMFMDYMDYTNDVCMNMFTKCQCNTMQSVLDDPNLRQSLQSSPGGCVGLAFNLDASISTIAFPYDTLPQQAFEPQVQLTNRGSEDLTYVKITYQVDGQTVSTYDYNGDLASEQSALVTLPVYFTSEGGHVFYAWTSDPNHGTDQFIYNDTSSMTFMVKSVVPKNTSSVDSSLTNGPFTFNIQNPGAGTMHYQIVNVLGQIVYEANADIIQHSSLTIDLPNLPPGMYFLYGNIGYDYVKRRIIEVR
ncbi:MAG: M43 family zinc metalloprotease [Chitinophagales bacterium]